MTAGYQSIALTGVPQTTLWSFWYRAAEARKKGAVISDPVAVEALERMDYDFPTVFGEPEATISLRSAYGDRLIRGFLDKHPDGNVIVLGEGLETQFWRSDNGRVIWHTVDLPETIDVRRRVLPAHERNRLIACSALDPAWTDKVQVNGPVFVSTSGLLMYFSRREVLWLIRLIADKYPGAELFMDVVSPLVAFLTRLRVGVKVTEHFTMPAMRSGVKLNRAARFFERVDGVHVRKVISFPEAFPEHDHDLDGLEHAGWFRNNVLGGIVEAEVAGR